MSGGGLIWEFSDDLSRSPWRFPIADLVYATSLGLASLVAYWIITRVLAPLVGREDDLLGGMWAVVAVAFVFRETYSQSWSAGLSRLLATGVSFALCLIYLLVLPFTPLGMAVLLALGAAIMMALDRREEVVTTSITTAVVMVVAALSPEPGWRQPVLRLADTVVGVSVGVSFGWLASVLLSRLSRTPGSKRDGR